MSTKKLGRYDLIRVLGKGAMGLVYEGRDPNLDRRVAIKTIKVENLSDDAAAEYEVRFRTEARSAARLQHPNIVSVYDSDRDGDIAFLVMEFVEGDDLKHHLDKGEVYTLEQTLGIMADLLSALGYAHKQHIVHRDIKPANLLVQASGRIKLADFGVARIQDSGEATRTQGSIVGTLKYMSPEQLEGRPIDARADLFAAGVVLYQLLTGTRPFDGDTDFAVIQKIASHNPAAVTVSNPRLPPAIDAVVAKSLAKSRDLRYASAQEFADALQAACKEATDITMAPTATRPGKGATATWTATMLAGESLVTTQSGISTGSGITSGTSASLVTQEVELVYWKDIKESTDIEDIQGFLTKFPSGIYADLARRRLKNLGGVSSGDATATLVASRSMTPAATDADNDPDKTMLLPKRDSSADQTPAAPERVTEAAAALNTNAAPSQTPELPAVSAMTANSPAASPAPSSPPKKGIWLVAGVGAVAVLGVAFKLLSGSSAAPPADLLAAPQASASVAMAPTPAASAAMPVASMAVRTAASSPSVTTAVLRPALAASKAAAATVAKKAAPDKDKASNASAKPADAAHAASATAATRATAPEASAGATSSANSPRAACEDRFLVGFQNCMQDQCNKPAFTRHPLCVERRAMEEKRREADRNK